MDNQDEEDYKLADAGSVAKRIEPYEWPFWKKILIFLSIGLFLIIILVVVIIMTNASDKEREDKIAEETIDEESVRGNIICEYIIERTSEKTNLLNPDFYVEEDSIDIAIDDKKVKFSKDYKFSKAGTYKIRFALFSKEMNLNNMFKGIQSLKIVSMSSEKNLKITSMISTFEDCIMLESWNMTGFDISQVKSV